MRKADKIKKKNIKIGGVCYRIRAINEMDLLGLDSYVPVFEINREHETNWINKSIDEQNEKLNKINKDRNKEFLRHLVYRCTEKISLSFPLRFKIFLSSIKVFLKHHCWEYQPNKFIDMLMNEDRCLNILYSFIHRLSFENIKVTQGINKGTAESIYFIYEGMNYADEFFKDTKLNAIEKYSFNSVIHNAGITAKNRRIKNG